MFMDSTLLYSSAQAISSTADSTNTLDHGGASTRLNIGKATIFGVDLGSGDGLDPYVLINVTADGTGAGTITFSLSGMIDNGSGAAGTATVMHSTKAFTGTDLDAGDVIIFPIPPVVKGQGLPRFTKLTYTVSGTATVTVTSGIVINPPTSLLAASKYPNNYTAV